MGARERMFQNREILFTKACRHDTCRVYLARGSRVGVRVYV